ncbi:hypothetical protein AYI98_17985 [Shewanella algae]|uniref:His-Xaa-Ser system radical SAM maturase HxsC n=1 Tax=Shewanella algae TaxID=38313 RepID=UPI001183323D|nr:His-Xaa-Ser system radical SAM maturase HxsC [Shewanella algae]TVL44065.1 hypothetical protein AYI98_17985 [Shewanella algae]
MSKVIKLQDNNVYLPNKNKIYDTVFYKITRTANIPKPLRHKYAIISKKDNEENGFGAYLFFENDTPVFFEKKNSYVLNQSFSYLNNGDVIRLSSPNRIRVIFRKTLNTNYLMVTEQCNSFCIMCSQPPRNVDDSYIVDEFISAIPYFDISAKEIGITGGEPTLLGDKFFLLLDRLSSFLPYTSLHVLTNGKNLSNIDIAKKLPINRFKDLMFGIPLYSDRFETHDFIVQDPGAFNKTLDGIYKLKKAGHKVELRFVIQKYNVQEMVSFAQFVTRNLQFVDQVAFMGLEATGFAKSNIESVWAEPLDYINNLFEAIQILDKAFIDVKIFNHQLCLLPKELWRFNCQSISDWKNGFIESCSTCSVKSQCGGFFTTSDRKIPMGIEPLVF